MKKATVKATKKNLILSMLAKGMKPKDIAKELKVGVKSVYSARYVAKKSGSAQTFKRRAPKMVLSYDKLPADAINRMTARVQMEDKVEALNVEIANLKHQIIGFRAVISYLEDLAGVRNSQ
jgi:transposase